VDNGEKPGSGSRGIVSFYSDKRFEWILKIQFMAKVKGKHFTNI
jgi:hypothetical protein